MDFRKSGWINFNVYDEKQSDGEFQKKECDVGNKGIMKTIKNA